MRRRWLTLHSSNNPILNLWDYGSQDAFINSYLSSTQRSMIFQHVGVLIYVFEANAHDAAKDAAYHRDCLDALPKYSPEAAMFSSFTRWISLRAEIGHRCWNAAHASCRRKVVPCTSRCLARASTTRRRTRYAIHRRFVLRTFLAFALTLTLPFTSSTLNVW